MSGGGGFVSVSFSVPLLLTVFVVALVLFGVTKLWLGK